MLPGWLYCEFNDLIAIMLSFLVRVYAIEFVIYMLYICYLDMLPGTLSVYYIYAIEYVCNLCRVIAIE